jgi:uncharacterized membrane protein HdeD (DUF308 family)
MNDRLLIPARLWWVLLLRGVVAIAVGVAAFAWPGLTIAILILLFGAFILFDGITAVIDAIRYRDTVQNWWLWLLDGVLGVVVGLMTLSWPGLTSVVLIWFIAAWSILGGILRIVAAIELRKQVKGEWLLILSGALSVLFGVAIIAVPHAGILSIAWLIGFWAIAFGTLFVLLAFRLKSQN